jgi:tRNA(fMet)-specific endonuclease VapC
MQIPVLIEPVAENGFQAIAAEPFRMTAMGATRDEAVRKLRDQIMKRLAKGGVLTTIEVSAGEEHPLAKYAGIWREDDPLIEEWKKAVEEYRRQVDYPMSLYILDTDMLTLYHRGHLLVRQRVLSHSPSELAITVISVEEELSGWYTLLRQAKQAPQVERVYQRLAESIPLLAQWRILSFVQAAIPRRDALRGLKLNVRKMDLRIAAITLESSGILVTRNLRDFQRVPNLSLEDWAA